MPAKNFDPGLPCGQCRPRGRRFVMIFFRTVRACPAAWPARQGRWRRWSAACLSGSTWAWISIKAVKSDCACAVHPTNWNRNYQMIPIAAPDFECISFFLVADLCVVGQPMFELRCGCPILAIFSKGGVFGSFFVRQSINDRP